VCASQVATATRHLPGVLALRLEPLDGLVVVRYDPSVTSAQVVRAAVQDAIDRVEN
jgi:hypothetical protein